MKRIVTLTLFLVLAVAGLRAQEPAVPPAPTGDQGASQETASNGSQPVKQHKPLERWRYDPAAKPGDPDNKGLKKINPNDINYGGVLAVWRVAMVQETIENIYWWMVLVLLVSQTISLAYIVWLQRQRHHRLVIAGDVLAQVTNLYLDARRRVFKITGEYNELVEKENAQFAQEQAAAEANNAPIDPSTKALRSLSAAQQSASSTAIVFPPEKPAAKSTFFESTDKQVQEAAPAAETSDDSLPLSVKAERFASTRYGSPAALGQDQRQDSSTQGSPQPSTPVAQTEPLAEVVPPKNTGDSKAVKDLLAELERTKTMLKELEDADIEREAELLRTKGMLTAREQQINNQRTVNRGLLDEIKSLKTPARGANQGDKAQAKGANQ
jgi:hypothetical protein